MSFVIFRKPKLLISSLSLLLVAFISLSHDKHYHRPSSFPDGYLKGQGIDFAFLAAFNSCLPSISPSNASSVDEIASYLSTVYLCMLRQKGRKDQRLLVLDCVSTETCFGLGDRLRGISSLFYLSLLTTSRFVINMQIPLSLDQFFAPNLYDWRPSTARDQRLGAPSSTTRPPVFGRASKRKLPPASPGPIQYWRFNWGELTVSDVKSMDPFDLLHSASVHRFFSNYACAELLVENAVLAPIASLYGIDRIGPDRLFGIAMRVLFKPSNMLAQMMDRERYQSGWTDAGRNRTTATSDRELIRESAKRQKDTEGVTARAGPVTAAGKKERIKVGSVNVEGGDWRYGTNETSSSSASDLWSRWLAPPGGEVPVVRIGVQVPTWIDVPFRVPARASWPCYDEALARLVIDETRALFKTYYGDGLQPRSTAQDSHAAGPRPELSASLITHIRRTHLVAFITSDSPSSIKHIRAILDRMDVPSMTTSSAGPVGHLHVATSARDAARTYLDWWTLSQADRLVVTRSSFGESAVMAAGYTRPASLIVGAGRWVDDDQCDLCRVHAFDWRMLGEPLPTLYTPLRVEDKQTM